MSDIYIYIYISNYQFVAKGLVAELAPLHVLNIWRSRKERVWTVELAVCCNYLKKYLSVITYNNW